MFQLCISGLGLHVFSKVPPGDGGSEEGATTEKEGFAEAGGRETSTGGNNWREVRGPPCGNGRQTLISAGVAVILFLFPIPLQVCLCYSMMSQM